MPEKLFEALVSQGRCPAEYAREVLGLEVTADDCAENQFDCRKCVKEVLQDDNE